MTLLIFSKDDQVLPVQIKFDYEKSKNNSFYSTSYLFDRLISFFQNKLELGLGFVYVWIWRTLFY